MRPPGAPAAIAATLVLVLGSIAPAIAAAEEPVTTTSASAPVLVVRSFTTSPAEVLLGQRFALTLSIRNETKPTAKDVVVSLGATAAGTSGENGGSSSTAGGADLVSLDSSDVRFVGDMKGHAWATVTFNLISSPRASAGVFSLPVNISSEVSGTRVTSSQNIGLVIGRVAMFSEQNVEIPSEGIVGEPLPVSLDVVNTATYAIPGVTLSLEGDAFTLKDASVLVGTIESGDSGTLEVQVTPKRSGDATLTVVASYRDDFGAVKEVRFSHAVKVQGAPEAPEEKPDASKEEPGGFLATVVTFLRGMLGLGG